MATEYTVDWLLAESLKLAVSQLEPLVEKANGPDGMSDSDLKQFKSLTDISISISKEERARVAEFDLASFSKEEQLALIDEAREIISKS